MQLKRLLFTACVLCISLGASAQKKNNIIEDAGDEKKVFEKVEMDASTNPAKWKAHIARYAVLPDSIAAALPSGNYIAVVQFVVDVHGNLGQFTVVTDPGHGLGARALRIIKSYPGKWQPASQCGRQVKAYRKQEIVFSVKGD